MNKTIIRVVGVCAISLLAGIVLYRCVRVEPRSEPGARTSNLISGNRSPVAAPYVPPVVKDARLGALVDRGAALPERVPDDISARIPKVSDPADIAALHSVLRDAADDDSARNAVADLLRRSHDGGLPDVLLSVLENPAESARFRSFAVQYLGGLELNESSESRMRITARLHGCLRDRDVEVRREALLALVRQRDAEAIAAAIAWLDSPARGADDVRDIAVRCIFDLNRREYLNKIRALANDPSESVRIAAIVALSSWGDQESRAACAACAKAGSVRLQHAGQAALARLDSAPGKPAK